MYNLAFAKLLSAIIAVFVCGGMAESQASEIILPLPATIHTAEMGTISLIQDDEDSLRTHDSIGNATVSIIEVKGAIGPTVLNYIERGLQASENRGDELFIIKLDTPGGLLDTTQDIVQQMLASTHPIAVYVSPDGATAGSAGAFITLAAHLAVMTPATNIGAASPVTFGGGEMDTVSQKKIFNFAETFIESIAEARDRNVDWAISAVRDGKASTASEALELNVIDFIATDLNDLLSQADGMEFEGKTLNTRDAAVIQIDQNLAEIFFGFIIRPEVLLILTLVSIYGILGEVSAPGSIIPGVTGVIALVLLLYGVAAMPINTAGFLLIILALILFISEAFTPTYGVLLAGGGVSFFLGALMLFQDLPEDMQLSLYWIVPATIITVIFFAWIVYYGIKAQFGGHRTGVEALSGKPAEVLEDVSETGGRVFFSGEYWNARSDTPIDAGQMCEIVRFEGLTVYVKPKSKEMEQ